ncbi:MAG: asparagine synthase (glutamine-hydrolyzing) [Desulfovibrionaceae bacterium]|nr:asparagine synthase (glutamine-hydrolyzing) [Desulfovibrionaceae bacterium]
MCGIAGYIGASPPDRDRIRECLERMRRRGPDASGTFTHAAADGHGTVLLHARLSIIDLSDRANQPYAEDPFTLVFNGEIYNYVEVREELKRLGRRFTTSSDTEVLLAALREWGAAGLDRLEGMWAFALHDARDGSLLLCRDRFGEKPLYLLRADQGLYFASEVKAVAALRGARPEPNLHHLHRFLINGYKALYKTGETFFKDVAELAPGCLLRVRPGEPERLERYWTVPAQAEAEMSFGEAVERTRDLLREAVRIRLRTDVPLAFCMSGGVDSNALISMARRELGQDVHGFTIMEDDARYDESELVRRSVAELGIRHTGITLDTAGFLENLRELVRYHDAPVATLSYYVHWLLMRSVARAGYKVVVSGTAADELFTGYYDHHNFYLRAVRNDAGLHAESLANWKRGIGTMVRNPFLKNPDVFIENPDERGHIYLEAEEFRRRIPVGFDEPFTETRYCDEPLRNRMLNELFHEVVPVILHEDDLNAMYYSLENRSPFLDRRLFEFSLTIPTRHLVRDGRAKAVLREAVRGIAPDAVVDNPRKVGFNASILSLLDTRDPAVREMLLADGPLYDHVRRDAVQALLDEPHFPNHESKFLFNVLGAKLFLEEYA